jgi:DNA polymerase-3 subunit beta
MKVTASRDRLAQGLTTVSRAVSARTTLPILSNVLLETGADGLHLTATNLEITIRVTVPAQVQSEGRVTVPARLLADLVAQLPSEDVSLTLDEKTSTLNVRCTQHNHNVKGIDAGEFPSLPSGDGGFTLRIPAGRLAQAVEQTVMAASTDEARPVLTGVQVQIKPQEIVLAATDGHRLAVKTLRIATEGEVSVDPLIVPRRALEELGRIIKSSEGDVEVSVSAQRNQLSFRADGVELSSRLIEGTYPNYTQVIPSAGHTTVHSDRRDLLQKARTVALMARDSANVVKLKTGEGSLVLTAHTNEVGDSQVEVPADIEGADLQIAFNARYLLDVLDVLGTDAVSLQFQGPLNPGLVKPDQGDDYLYVIMPVRVAI